MSFAVSWRRLPLGHLSNCCLSWPASYRAGCQEAVISYELFGLMLWKNDRDFIYRSLAWLHAFLKWLQACDIICSTGAGLQFLLCLHAVIFNTMPPWDEWKFYCHCKSYLQADADNFATCEYNVSTYKHPKISEQLLCRQGYKWRDSKQWLQCGEQKRSDSSVCSSNFEADEGKPEMHWRNTESHERWLSSTAFPKWLASPQQPSLFKASSDAGAEDLQEHLLCSSDPEWSSSPDLYSAPAGFSTVSFIEILRSVDKNLNQSPQIYLSKVSWNN